MNTTIIVPTYNRRHELPGALAALAESVVPLSVIVVNDGGENVQDLCPPSVTYLSPPHGGLAAAFNTGLAAVTTEFVGFLPDDDRIFPQHVRILSSVLAVVDERIGAAHSFFRIRYRRRNDAAQWEDYAYNDVAFAQPFAPQALPFGGNVATPAMLFRTDFIRDLGGWDPDLAFADLDLVMRVGAATAIATVPIVTGEITQRDDPTEHYGRKACMGETGVENLRVLWNKHPSDDPSVIAGRKSAEAFVAAATPFPPTRYLQPA